MRRNDSVVCRTDGGGMSRDVFPTQIQVPVFFMTRLCANAEIGVPREELPFSGTTPAPLLYALPSSHFPSFLLPRHSCSPVIPAKAGILIRMWTSRATHHPDPHQKLQDIQTTNNPYFKRLSRVVGNNSTPLINNTSR